MSADPQKQYADVVIEVLPTQLIPGDDEGKVLRVRMIQKEGVKFFNPVYLFDEGSTINWIPCGKKLTCSYPGIKFSYGPETYYGNEVALIRIYTLATHFTCSEKQHKYRVLFCFIQFATFYLILQATVVEMDGQFDRLDELIYVESHLSNLSTKFYGEVTQQMLKHQEFPGSNNGTGFFQTIIGLKIRDLFEQIVASRSATPAAAAKA